jgi:hypothetical protein
LKKLKLIQGTTSEKQKLLKKLKLMKKLKLIQGTASEKQKLLKKLKLIQGTAIDK